MKVKRYLCVLITVTLISLLISFPASAGAGTKKINCTVPATISLSIDSNTDVTCESGLTINNSGTYKVKVKSIKVVLNEPYHLVAWDTDFGDLSVDSGAIAIRINGYDPDDTGTFGSGVVADILSATKGSFTIEAKSGALSKEIQDLSIGTLEITLSA